MQIPAKLKVLQFATLITHEVLSVLAVYPGLHIVQTPAESTVLQFKIEISQEVHPIFGVYPELQACISLPNQIFYNLQH